MFNNYDSNYAVISSLVDKCRNERDVDRQIRILRHINSKLPESKKLKMPSLLTNDYVHRALDIIDENLVQ